MKTGLVMEGGAMRGLFTAGVIDVLMENQIEVDGAIGSSAGAAFGVNYVSHQPGRVLRYNLRFCRDSRFCSLQSWIKTGNLYNVDFGYYTIPEKLDPFDYETFAKSPITFYATATDVTTGQPVYHKFKDCRGDDIKWLIASASMPLAAKPVEVGGRKLLDGGMGDSIPLKFMEEHGYERNIVILTQPPVYKKTKPIYMPAIHMFLADYPNMVHTIDVRPDMYNRQVHYINKQAKAKKAFIIQPPARLGVGPVCKDRDELRRVYKLGRTTAKRRLDELKKWLVEDGAF